MRIAHIITRMIIGGAQENTLYNCLDLVADFGDDVVLITGPTLGPEGKLLEQGRAGGLAVRQIDSLRRAIHPWYDLQAYRALVRTLDEFQPEVVHTHSAKGGFLGRAAAWNRKTPAVLHTVHGAPFHPYQSSLARNLYIRLERWAARRCHHMISVADAMTDLMVDARVAPREMFTTIYSGMDVQPFLECWQLRDSAREAIGFEPQDIVFGKIARLFNLKGHTYLFEAAQRVIRAVPNARFLLVGDGVFRQQFERTVQQLGMERNFRFVGLVPPEQIPYYLSAMDCLVHTSLREGLARTLPQALLSGIPAISYDVDGAREVVIPEQTGFLLPAKSIEPLADAMVQLARDPALRERLGRAGRELCVQRFPHRLMTAQIRELYLSVLSRHQKNRQ